MIALSLMAALILIVGCSGHSGDVSSDVQSHTKNLLIVLETAVEELPTDFTDQSLLQAITTTFENEMAASETAFRRDSSARISSTAQGGGGNSKTVVVDFVNGHDGVVVIVVREFSTFSANRPTCVCIVREGSDGFVMRTHRLDKLHP
jgi:hypothetical protein